MADTTRRTSTALGQARTAGQLPAGPAVIGHADVSRHATRQSAAQSDDGAIVALP